ncbi:uncharacterized protein [Argopecten irradians]|uniref:uncharacterized protein n=1 Tax=Argopecten irradians TaxID=31199 RepID=UPI003717AE91
MSRSQFNDRILRGFILSSDSLFEIRQLLDRRQKTKFSEGLSPEARLVLKQMDDDTRGNYNVDSDDNSAGDNEQKYSGGKRVQISKKSPRKSGKTRKQITFTDSPRETKVKLTTQTRDVINTEPSSAREVKGQRSADLLTSDPNPVDKCREWVAGNDRHIVAGSKLVSTSHGVSS